MKGERGKDLQYSNTLRDAAYSIEIIIFRSRFCFNDQHFWRWSNASDHWLMISLKASDTVHKSAADHDVVDLIYIAGELKPN